VQTFRSAYCQV